MILSIHITNSIFNHITCVTFVLRFIEFNAFFFFLLGIGVQCHCLRSDKSETHSLNIWLVSSEQLYIIKNRGSATFVVIVRYLHALVEIVLWEFIARICLLKNGAHTFNSPTSVYDIKIIQWGFSSLLCWIYFIICLKIAMKIGKVG
jgi:hypothetical protein